MKIHNGIIQETLTTSQNSLPESQKSQKDDFRALLEKALKVSETSPTGEPPLRENLREVLGLVEEVIGLLEAAAQGQKEAFPRLEEKAYELHRTSALFSGAARQFFEEISLLAAVNSAKAREGFI